LKASTSQRPWIFCIVPKNWIELSFVFAAGTISSKSTWVGVAESTVHWWNVFPPARNGMTGTLPASHAERLIPVRRSGVTRFQAASTSCRLTA
jgi:hypothetical protein